MKEYGALAEWYWQGKLKYREKNLSKWHSVHLKSHMDCWDRMLTSTVRVRRLTAWQMSWQTFRYDAVTQQSVLEFGQGTHSLNHSPFSSGSFCSSRFLLMLNLDELCRLSFLMCGGPGYLILLIWVGGGTLAPGESCCCCGCCCSWGDGDGCVELELVFISSLLTRFSFPPFLPFPILFFVGSFSFFGLLGIFLRFISWRQNSTTYNLKAHLLYRLTNIQERIVKSKYELYYSNLILCN